MKTWLLWLIAFVVTLTTAIYQRSTGPTHPKSIAGDGYVLSCPRSLITEINPQQAQGDWESLNKTSVLKIRVKTPKDGREGVMLLSDDTQAHLYYKRARSQEEWQAVALTAGAKGRLEALLPSQPPAGKLAYYINISGQALSQENPIIIRFRNDVPAWALLPHILFMFVAMLFSTFCGLFVLKRNSNWKKYAWMCFATLLAGGFILGPIIQKYAFGAYWTGWPLGDDLTDTKTLVAAGFWLVALLFAGKKSGRLLAVLAAVALLVVFSIPHSTAGSEFNYETGLVETEPIRRE